VDCPDGCLNGGWCTDVGCACPPGFAGPRCQQDTLLCPRVNGTAPIAGLRGEYFNDTAMANRALTRIDATLLFAGDLPNFAAVVWTGYLRPERSGWHTVITEATYAWTTVWLDGVLLAPAARRTFRPVYLHAGRYHSLRVQLSEEVFSDFKFMLRGPDAFAVRAAPPGPSSPDRSPAAQTPNISSLLFHSGGVCSCPVDALGAVCGGRGACVNGACVCTARYYGDACERRRCRNEPCANGVCDGCNGRGACADGQCACESGFDAAQNCLFADCSAGGRVCGNSGTCSGGSCVCVGDFTGPGCESTNGGGAARQPGWHATFFADNFTKPRVARAAQAVYASNLNGDTADWDQGTSWTASWTGVVHARVAGLHQFSLTGPDGGAYATIGSTSLSATGTTENMTVVLAAGQSLSVAVTANMLANRAGTVALLWAEPGRGPPRIVAPDAVTHQATCAGCQGTCVGVGGCVCPEGRVGPRCDQICESAVTVPGWRASYFGSAANMSNASLAAYVTVVPAVSQTWCGRSAWAQPP
jgi:hypothetical protein